jgi:hypothetical protein
LKTTKNSKSSRPAGGVKAKEHSYATIAYPNSGELGVIPQKGTAMPVPTFLSLALELSTRWGLDEPRTIRALNLVAGNGQNVKRAKKNEVGQRIDPSDSLWIVRSSNGGGWYYVKPEEKSCTCKDHQNGHVCKHRRAVWLVSELPNRVAESVRDGSAANPSPGIVKVALKAAKQREEREARTMEERNRKFREDAQKREDHAREIQARREAARKEREQALPVDEIITELGF